MGKRKKRASRKYSSRRKPVKRTTTDMGPRPSPEELVTTNDPNPNQGGVIQAKPTTYRGIHFRSRLEARWAVYLDWHPMIDYWEYEPTTIKDGGTGWEYTPDFVIQTGNTLHSWLEVKPQPPTQDYLENLQVFIPHLRGCVGYHLLLCCGDFYQGVPRIMELIPQRHHTVRQFEAYAKSLTGVPILGHPPTAELAGSYRFDLPERHPPAKQTNTQNPFDHWRAWQEEQRTHNDS